MPQTEFNCTRAVRAVPTLLQRLRGHNIASDHYPGTRHRRHDTADILSVEIYEPRCIRGYY